jgi:hypothetical protein
VQDFKVGDRVKVTMTRSFEGDVVVHAESPSGLAVHVPRSGTIWLDEEGGGGFVHTYELIAPAEPPVGSVLVDSDGDVWQCRARFWYCIGRSTPASWSEVSQFGPFTVLREGWGE